MSHAHHFLSRLDRVSVPHIELALSLYNDVDLLRFILGRARLPENAPRAAISLDHPERGPFLVVTREGRFVTCLGEGMTCGDLPVVTRGQLDGIAAKAGDLRVRMEACQRLAGARGGVTKLLRRLYDAADELSREEFIAISALQPLYVFGFLHCLFGAGEDLLQARNRLLPHLRRSERLKPELYSAARAYWNTFWAIGHLSILMAMEGPGLFDRLPAQVSAMLNGQSLSWAAVRQGVMGLALKGSWATARLGKAVLPTYKRLFHVSGSELTVLDAGMGLVALGMRHTRLRAEVSKVLASGPDIDPATLGGKIVHPITRMLVAFFDMATEAPEDVAAMHRRMGAKACLHAVKHLPRGAPLRFERVEDVPEALAMTIGGNLPFPFIGQPEDAETLLPLFTALPWVARAAPEDLYLPRDFIKAIHTPWKPEHTCDLLLHHRDHYKHPTKPLPRSQRAPTLNGPCACGSGKKFKRCCGVEAAE